MMNIPALGKDHRFVDISGERFGRLVAVERDFTSKKKKAVWRCACDCGSDAFVTGTDLRSGNTKSCGCGRAIANVRTHTTHGQAKSTGETRAYMIWMSMRRRCHSITCSDYQYYGARGIQVCQRWRDSFADFFADMGEPPPGSSLDRVNNDDGYSKSNCTWATRLDQSNNTRTNVMIETPSGVMTMAQFARMTGINYDNIRAKLRRGVSNIAGFDIKHYTRGESK